MDSGRPSEGWDHVNPFEDDQNQNSPGNNQVDNVPSNHESRASSSHVEEKAEADSSESPRRSLDEIDTKQEHSSSHDDNVIDKVKTAAQEAKARFHLQSMRATGPSKRFNPTNVRMHVRFKGSEDNTQDDAEADPSKLPPRQQTDFNILWRSRDNRKGRGSIAVRRMASLHEEDSHIHIGSTIQSTKEIGKGIWRMCSTFPYWNIAFWSGWAYAWGSVLFIWSASWSWEALAFPDTYNNESIATYGVPLTTFFGVLLYQLGATAAYLEAVNDGSFHGSAMRRLLEGHEDEEHRLAHDKIHHFFDHFIPHPHKSKEEKQAEEFANAVDPEAGWKTRDIRQRPGSIYPVGKSPAPRRGGVDWGEAEEGESTEYMTWRWWPTWKALRTHHAYEIGYLACSIQGFGVTLFGWTGVALLPGVFDNLGGMWGEIGAYWIPQMIASLCFCIASAMFMFETQEKWWKPQMNVLGWWIGFIALLGSLGFELCALFGCVSEFGHPWAEYQSSLSSMWGSSFFLISSLLQWYEAINKHPIAELFNEPGELKSYQVHPI